MCVLVFAGRFRPYPLSRIYCWLPSAQTLFKFLSSRIANHEPTSQPANRSFVRSFTRSYPSSYLIHTATATATALQCQFQHPSRPILKTQPSIFLNSFALLRTRSTFFPSSFFPCSVQFSLVQFSVFVFICASFARFFKVFHFLLVTCNAIRIYIYFSQSAYTRIWCSHRRKGRGWIREEGKKTQTRKIYGALPYSL